MSSSEAVRCSVGSTKLIVVVVCWKHQNFLRWWSVGSTKLIVVVVCWKQQTYCGVMCLLLDTLQARCSWSCGRGRTLSWPMSGMWSSSKRMNRTDHPSLEPNTKRCSATARDLRPFSVASFPSLCVYMLHTAQAETNKQTNKNKQTKNNNKNGWTIQFGFGHFVNWSECGRTGQHVPVRGHCAHCQDERMIL